MYLTSNGTHMYQISIERQVIRPANDMNNIRMEENLEFFGQPYLT